MHGSFYQRHLGKRVVRTDLIVYDPVQEELYVLDGYNYDYLIDHAERRTGL